MMQATFDELSALAVSADLYCCEVDESASILHRWLRQHCPHDAIAITTSGSPAPLSQWTSPTFELPAEVDWSSRTAVGDLGLPIVAAVGDAARSDVTIVVVLSGRSPAPCSRLVRALQGLARLLAARIGSSPAGAETAELSLAHAVAGERDRVTRELTDHFAQHLHTIINHLRDGAAGDARARVQAATSVGSRALVDLRDERRPVWREARPVDEAFGVLERDLGELARAAGIRLDPSLTGRQVQSVPNSVLETACAITRAAMLNVAEHSGAARARIEWRVEPDQLVLCVVDDGTGFDPQLVACGGLGAMRRRVEMLGGSLGVDSAPGWGTRIQARLRLNVDHGVQADESARALLSTLGDRGLDVLRLLAAGYRNREIASELFLSQHTVKFHVASIFEKLGVRTRAEAAAVAFAAGLRADAEPAAAAA